MPKNQLRKFLSEHHTPGRPLVVGVSGGSDSLTLLFSLHALGVEAHVAHLDHGWREESAAEARALEELVRERTGFPFHVRRAAPPQGNWEMHGRGQRHDFFSDVCLKVGAEAVLLAHHAGDQAETVFKRVVEGAPMCKLGGMAPVTEVAGLTIWRPFLGLPRAALACEPLVDDPSNRDPRYQRALLRHEVLPRLGRGVERTLGRLGQEAQELDDYLDRRIAELDVEMRDGWMGRWVQVPDIHRMEMRHLVRRVCYWLGWEDVDRICTLLAEKRANKQVLDVEIDRGRIFLPDGWGELLVERGRGPAGWEALWQGASSVEVPIGGRPGPAVPSARVPGHKTLSHWYNAHCVPAFLRKQVPVIYKNGVVVGEFLTGKTLVQGEPTIFLTCAVRGYKKSNGGRILLDLPSGRNQS